MKNNNRNLVTKANKVITASYRLSVNEQRVLLFCIAKIDSRIGAKALTVENEFTVTAKEFSKLTNCSLQAAYVGLKEASEALYERSLTVDEPCANNPNAKRKTRWVSSILYKPDSGKIALRFAFDVLPYLSQLHDQFTSYNLSEIGSLDSVYAIRLFELLMQYKSQGWYMIELTTLKEMLQLDDSYERLDNLKRRVIDIAVKQINDHTSYTVSYTQEKQGRVVTHFIFTFSAKETRFSTMKNLQLKSLKLTKQQIEQHARPGESYEQAEERIRLNGLHKPI